MTSPESAIDIPTDPTPAPGPAAAMRKIPWAATWILIITTSAILNAAMVFATGRGSFLPLLMTCTCLVAALFDGWTHRIPNPLTYTAILLGIVLNALEPLARNYAPTAAIWLGAPGIRESLIGFLICITLAVIGHLFKGVYGGDLKLLAAVGATLGLSNTTTVIVFALLIALVYAAINLVVLGRLNKVLRVATQRILELFYLRKFHTPIPEPLPASHIPMALPMALALVLAMALQLRLPIGGHL